MKGGTGSVELINTKGPELLEYTYKFLSDKKHQTVPKSPEFIELENHQKLLANFIAVQKHFEKCVKDKDNKRDLSNRILGAAHQNLLNDHLGGPCLSSTNNFENFYDFNNDLENLMKAAVVPQFYDELTKQIISNTAKSLTTFRYKFEPEFMKLGSSSPAEMNSLLDEVCLNKLGNSRIIDTCQALGNSFRLQLKRDIEEQAKKISEKEEKFSSESATQSLNNSIDRLNDRLIEIKLKSEKGLIFDGPMLNDKNSQAQFNLYTEKYLSEVQKDAGVLLLTNSLKSKAGNLKKFDSTNLKKDTNTAEYVFIPHERVGVKDVKKSVQEAQTKILAQLQSVKNLVQSKKEHSSDNRLMQETIKDLVKLNPFAAGGILVRNPQYASLMCDAINQIASDDNFTKTMDEAFVAGAAILGGALILTAVGAAVGAYLVSGSLAAGFAAGTTSGSIVFYSTLSAGLSEMVSLGHYGQLSLQNYDEMNRLESAYLTNNSDSKSIQEAEDSLIEYKAARLSAILSLGNVGLISLTGGKFFNLLKVLGNPSTPSELSAAAKIMIAMKETVVAKKLNAIILKLGINGSQMFDQFLLSLVKSPGPMRAKFIEMLKDSKITPAAIKDFILRWQMVAKNITAEVVKNEINIAKISNPLFTLNEKKEIISTFLKLNLSKQESKKIIKKINNLVKNPTEKNRLRSYINFVSSLPLAEQKLALSQLHDAILVPSKLMPNGFVEQFLKKEKKFDLYQNYKENTLKEKLIKEGRSEKEAVREASEAANEGRMALQKKYYACQSKTLTPEYEAATKRFGVMSLTLAVSAEAYGYTKANQEMFKEDKSHWFKKLTYEVLGTYILTKLSMNILKAPEGSFGKKYVQTNIIAAKIGTLDAVAYNTLFGSSENEAQKKLTEILKSPDAKKELEILDNYIDKNNLLEKFEKTLMESYKKIIDSPDKETLIGKPPYEIGGMKFSTLTSEDLNRPEIKEKLMKAILMQMNSGDLSAAFTTGDKGADRWIYDRGWMTMIGVPKGLILGLGISQILCMGSERPFASMGTAAAIQLANQFISNENYYGIRKEIIGQ